MLEPQDRIIARITEIARLLSAGPSAAPSTNPSEAHSSAPTILFKDNKGP